MASKVARDPHVHLSDMIMVRSSGVGNRGPLRARTRRSAAPSLACACLFLLNLVSLVASGQAIDGTWSGITSQGEPVSIQLVGTGGEAYAARAVTFGIALPGCTITNSVEYSSPVALSGSQLNVTGGSGRDSYAVSFVVSPGDFGTGSISYKSGNCGSGQVTFSANRVPSPAGFGVVPHASGSLRNSFVGATVHPAPEDVNRFGKVYVAAQIGGQLFFLDSGGAWILWTGGPLPHRYEGPLQASHFTVALQGLDVSAYVGTSLYVGAGASDLDVLDNAKYRFIHVVQQNFFDGLHGTYTGSIEGPLSGTFRLVVDYSGGDFAFFDVQATIGATSNLSTFGSVSSDGKIQFTFFPPDFPASSTISFNGVISANSMSGSWSRGSEGGTFTGAKLR